MTKTKKRNRYQEKLKGAKRRPMPVVVCRSCLCRHCTCGIPEGPFFEMDAETVREWYGTK